MNAAAWVGFALAMMAGGLAVLCRREAKQLRAERRRTETLAEENARLSVFLAALRSITAHAVFIVDESRRVLWMNEAAREQFAGPIDAGHSLEQIISHPEVLELVTRAVSERLPQERQYMREGASYHAQALPIEASRLIAVRVRDITELQRLGRARRDFVANISHDLRTPISAIQVMAETLKSSSVAENPRKRKQLVDGILEQTSALQQLAQEILDLSLIESGRMPLRLVAFPVGDLIGPALRPMMSSIERNKLHVEVHIPDDLKVLADPEHVRRVLQNLLHNAIKFTPAEGVIIIEAREQGEDIVISVSDSGPGIAADDLPRIFERFYKVDRMRSERGTGLGLAIARHIVEGHGGRIWAESAPGRGATFYFTLPRA
ncbi:MAG: PAS domain-containing sensor histidine kinase [Chloroflexi bacterium]|nr:PAS domain-containing sensor histidine kinase [Chloroflexota bacterium]